MEPENLIQWLFISSLDSVFKLYKINWWVILMGYVAEQFSAGDHSSTKESVALSLSDFLRNGTGQNKMNPQ